MAYNKSYKITFSQMLMQIEPVEDTLEIINNFSEEDKNKLVKKMKEEGFIPVPFVFSESIRFQGHA